MFPVDEAQNLLLRAELMLQIERYVKRSGATQQTAAKALGVTQPRLNQLRKGRIEIFSLDALVNMLAKVGLAR
jgi:predicted XRE-type DNA-binding protein